MTLPVAPDIAGSLAPGSYRAVTIGSRATMSLASGDYFMDSLDLEPQATLSIGSQSVRLIVGSNIVVRGNVVGTRAPALIYFGSNDVVVEAPLSATIAAPNARVTLGAGTALSFSGTLFARDIVLRPDVVFQCAQH